VSWPDDSPLMRTPGRKAWFVAGAICAALSAAGLVNAQTVPYQSSQRAMIGAGIGQTALPRGGTFEPRLEAAIQYADNINLAQAGEKAVNTAGIELAPGFYASYSSGSMNAAIDYSLIGRVWDDSDYNDVTQRLEANGEWLAVPEWFSVSGQASYGDAIIDPRASLNTGGVGIFGPNNLTEYAAASVSPALRHRFNDFQAVAQYTYGRVWYFNQGKGQPVVGFVTQQNSQDQEAHLSFGTADDNRRFSGTAFYEWQRSEYDTALPYVFERVGFDTGVQLGQTIWLVGDVGRESDLDKSTTQGGLDSNFWSAGIRWAPNKRTSAEARYGERFFGQSYSFKFTHQARLLQFDASYSEEPRPVRPGDAAAGYSTGSWKRRPEFITVHREKCPRVHQGRWITNSIDVVRILR
jgi:uncharacterized protein (PEP-CTERM system associated)